MPDSYPVRPPRLVPGDLIAVCTPSGAGAPMAPRRFERGLEYLRGRGFQVRVGAAAWREGYAAGDAGHRADELNSAIRDPEVRAIVAAIGGYTTNRILPYVDFAALAADPKIIIGYSDITALLLAVHARTGMVTFHGPTLMPELAEHPAPLGYTEQALWTVVSTPRAPGRLNPPGEWTEEFLAWDVADDRPRLSRPHDGWEWIVPGTGTGPLLGGNLDTMCALTGTAYLPRSDGAVFFWETCSTSLAEIDRNLTHLECAGVVSGVSGMIVGRSFRGDATFESRLRAFLADRLAGAPYPVVTGVDLGHADPMLTLPVGVRCRLDSASDVIELAEPAVG
jgi:muramoyltetrapeptide carboxypeptidase LdcA involved in peptidoglycan recycling